jgi:hypothetical protein
VVIPWSGSAPLPPVSLFGVSGEGAVENGPDFDTVHVFDAAADDEHTFRMRVEVRGSSVVIIDAATDRALGELDAAALGTDPGELADLVATGGRVERSGLLVVSGEQVEPIAAPWGAEESLGSVDGRFIALRPAGAVVGGPWGSPLNEPGLWESDDGRTWSYVGRPDLLYLGDMQLVEATAVGGVMRYIAITGSRVDGSDDGLAWRWLGSAPGQVIAVDHGLVAISKPNIHVSTDGQSWSLVEHPGSTMSPGSSHWDPYQVGDNTIAVPDSRGEQGLTWLLRFEADS